MWRTVCSHLFCTYPFLVPLGDPCLLIGTDMYKGTCRSLSIHPVPLKITDLSEQSRLRIPILFSCSLLIWCFGDCCCLFLCLWSFPSLEIRPELSVTQDVSILNLNGTHAQKKKNPDGLMFSVVENSFKKVFIFLCNFDIYLRFSANHSFPGNLC